VGMRALACWDCGFGSGRCREYHLLWLLFVG